MRYLSVCSGIEAATVAWHDMGWEAAAYSEIEKFPSEVLKHHYPLVPNMGDMTKYKEWEIGTIGLLVGGTPCQSFSVAGLRKGLEDPRGNLALTYVGILDKFRPKWFVWENVPGVLSSSGGRDFGSFLGAVAQLGYGFSYRVLDAQYFGVAQRRRRVFVVGHLGDWQPTAKVLFESESLFRNTQSITKTQQKNAISINRNFEETIAIDYRNVRDFSNENLKTFPSLTASDYKTPKSIAFKIRGGCEGGGKGYLGKDEKAFTLSTLQDQSIYAVRTANTSSNGCGISNKSTYTLDSTQGQAITNNMAIRRLTPVECERLQGFPDNYTNIKENCPDGSRYKALGNSMAVPVMKWIGNRIQMVENKIL